MTTCSAANRDTSHLLQVCGEHDVPVRLEAPSLSDIDSWQGAFISSTSRLLLPVSEVMYEVNGQQQRKVSCRVLYACAICPV